MTKIHCIVGACLALNLGLSSAAETAGDQAKRTVAGTQAVKIPVGGHSGAAQRIYRDPVTGEFTTPPAGVQEIPQQFQQTPGGDTSAEGLDVVTHPDGSKSVDLQGRFQSTVFATIDKDGHIDVGHQPGSAGASAPVSADDKAGTR